MVTKFVTSADVGDPYPCANFYYDSIRVFAPFPRAARMLQCIYRVNWLFWGSSSSLEASPPAPIFTINVK